MSGDYSRAERYNMGPPPVDSRPSRMRSSSSGARKHRRGSSSASLTSAPVPFPAFDGADDSVIAPLPMAYTDLNSNRSPSTSNSSKMKIKPFLRKTSSHEKGSLDLSRSQAENEGLGIYTSSNNLRRDTPAGGNRGYHTRNSSAVSQMSATTTTSTHRPAAHYIHPNRQTPHTYTPPLLSRRNSNDGEVQSPSLGSSYATTNSQAYAPLPPKKRSQPGLQIRTQTSTNRLHSTSQSNVNLPGTPSSLRYQDTMFSPETNGTARSSFDSTFLKRSRTNTVDALPEDPQAAVAVLRAQFEAKEAAKSEKYAQQERRAAEKASRREEAKRAKEAHAAERKRSRSNVGSEKSVPLSSIEYNSTNALPVDEELQYIRRGKMPPPHVRSYTNEKQGRARGPHGSQENIPSKGLGSRWSAFMFHFKTAWLKFLRNVGLRNRR